MTDLDTALIANSDRPATDELTATNKMLEALRLTIRKAQLELRESPDPASPWWFLVDIDAEFDPKAPTQPPLPRAG
jgi:hypothetical protein